MIKFWLAKELAHLMVGVAVIGCVGLVYGFIWLLIYLSGRRK